MPDYLTMADLNARIPGTFLTQALDDNGDGSADTDAFTNIQSAVQTEIDGILGARFTTPFSNPIPAIVQDAARVLACDLIYKRRAVADKENPWAAQAASLRDRLAKIAEGKLPLSPGLERQAASVSIISETSKLQSAKGKNQA